MADDTQLFINNWSTTISNATLGVGDTAVSIPSADSVALGPIAANEYYVATMSDGSSLEVVWITANDEAGNITIARAKEGTTALSYVSGHSIECRNTKGTYENFAQKDAVQTLTQKTLTSPTLVTPALGTPASGDLRNCSMAVAPAIGGTTPASGTFTALTATGTVELAGITWPAADGSIDQVLKTDGSGQLSFADQSSSGLTDVVDDTSPQLGGDLDVNGNGIISVDNEDIEITPNGTGDLILDGLKWPQVDGSANQILVTNGSAQLSWASAGAPEAHKDTHDPEDGADALDTAAPAELASVQAAATGSSHSLARADHVHQIQHSIADNHLVTVDGDPADDEYARWTANGLEGRSAAEAKTDLGFITDVVDDTSPQLGGTLDINEKSVQFEFGTLTDDHTASGDIISATAGENVAFGDVCYFKSDGKFWKTDADAVATAKGMLAMAIATISADAAGLFLVKGLARDDTWDWTVAAELYLDTATAGGLTETAPSGDEDIVRIAGYAKAADYVWFDPDKSYVEVSA
jgi:hypothetical protein